MVYTNRRERILQQLKKYNIPRVDIETVWEIGKEMFDHELKDVWAQYAIVRSFKNGYHHSKYDRLVVIIDCKWLVYQRFIILDDYWINEMTGKEMSTEDEKEFLNLLRDSHCRYHVSSRHCFPSSLTNILEIPTTTQRM